MNLRDRAEYIEKIRAKKENLKGKTFSIEGSEGSGKGTISDMLEAILKEADIPMLLTREPGGVPISEEIREIIVSKKNTSMTSKVETLLFAAARNQHLEEKVIPAIKEGKMVLFDRFVDSSYAYQGYARGEDINQVIAINQFAMNGFDVDKVFYLDIDPEMGLNRIRINNRETNRLDVESLNFYKKIREGFLYIKEHIRKDKMIVINAEPSSEIVFESVLKALLEE